jgi:hypothetical protein
MISIIAITHEAKGKTKKKKYNHSGPTDTHANNKGREQPQLRPAKRNWKIFFDFVQILIRETTKLYRNDHIKLDIDEAVYALDSTTIDLCLTLFPWASFRKTSIAVLGHAIKMHTMIDLRCKTCALQRSCKKQCRSLFPRGKYTMSTRWIILIGNPAVGMSWIAVTLTLSICITFTNVNRGLSPAVKRILCTSGSIQKKLTKAKASCVIKKCG